jgi:hypothetical protein
MPARTTHKISAPRINAINVLAKRIMMVIFHEMPSEVRIVTLMSRPTNEKRIPLIIR